MRPAAEWTQLFEQSTEAKRKACKGRKTLRGLFQFALNTSTNGLVRRGDLLQKLSARPGN
jgi:hypothetical protein